MSKYYWAGIGSRETPPEILKMMTQIGYLLGVSGGVCKTGAALGADQSFAEGAYIAGDVVLLLPWSTYEKEWVGNHHRAIVRVLVPQTHTAAMESVNLHPAIIAGRTLSQAVVKLHARNYLIIEGCKFVVCWAPLDAQGNPKGGTGQGCKIAEAKGIPIYNLAVPETLNAFTADIIKRFDELPDNLK